MGAVQTDSDSSRNLVGLSRRGDDLQPLPVCSGSGPSSHAAVSSVALSPQSLPPPSSLQPETQTSAPRSPPCEQQLTEGESPGQRTVEVAIPNVGTFVIESEEGGYDDQVAQWSGCAAVC